MILGDGTEVGDIYSPDPVPHRSDLVEVEFDHRKLKGKEFALTTPFSGKKFCFGSYMRGLNRLPLSKAHAVWYDNSNSKTFGKKLRNTLKENFDSYTLIKDANDPYTVDASCYEYPTIVNRMRGIYTSLLADNTPDLPLTLNVEDDVEVPDNADRLWSIMDNYPEVGTVVGHQLSRPVKDWKGNAPIAVNFEKIQYIGGPNSNTPKVDVQWIEDKRDFGIEPVGGAHMGLWLTRTPIIKKVGFGGDVDGIIGLDLYWGYKLNLAGYKMLIDWSVKAKHHYLKDGKACYV
jgi:hypothetical protein